MAIAPSVMTAADIDAAGGTIALQTHEITTAPAMPLTESSYNVALGNGPVRQLSISLSGASTAGTPGSGADANSSYRNAVELTPDYLFMYNTTGWNNGPGSNSGRTGIAMTRRKLVHNGPGDAIAFNASVRITSVFAGATHWLASPAGVVLNGTVIGEADGVYLNPFELLLKDSTGSTAQFTADITSGSDTLTNVSGNLKVGDALTHPNLRSGSVVSAINGTSAQLTRYSNYVEVPATVTAASVAGTSITRVVSNRVACAGLVLNMERNRSSEPGSNFGGAGIGEPWWGLRIQARGTRPIDSALSLTGKAYVGIDFSTPYLKFENDAAIALKAGMRRYFNATGLQQDDATVFVRDNTRMTGGFSDYDYYDSTNLQYKVVVGGNETLKVSNGQVTGTKFTSGTMTLDGTQNKLFINGQTVVGARKTGWGPWTGNAVRTSKATYTAGAGLTFGAAYSQAEHTALAARLALVETALQDVMQAFKALTDDLSITGGSHGLIGA